MALELDVELSLEERFDDSVVVSVYLCPEGRTATVDGVALRLRDKHGRGLGPRVLLPISGLLRQIMRTTVELKPEDGVDVPLGATVQVVAWHEQEQREASVPTDPMTAFEEHVRGSRSWNRMDGDRFLMELLPEERAAVAAEHPWIDEPRLPPSAKAALGVVDSQAPQEDEHGVDAFAEEMGLDDESAEWLKDLMDQ